MTLFGLFFWSAVFLIFYRVLYYFTTINVFGDFLAAKLLSMILLTFLSILVFSNIITAISSFFISEELQLIISAPYDTDELYYTKLIETILNSSWMVLLFSLPVFLCYGVIFKQGPQYYITMISTLVPFVIICGCSGIAIAILLVRLFPAKRLKDILFLLSIFLIIVLYMLFRVLRPERLVNPDEFFTVVDYLTSLETPSSPFLPSQWVTDILSFFLFNDSSGSLLFTLLCIWSTALAFIVLLNWLFKATFYPAWSKSQESRTVRVSRKKIFNTIVNIVLRPLSPDIRAIAEKDIRTFMRDTAQWSQLFILSAIIVIYLYNFSVLPLDKSPIPTRQLQNIISFLNLGLAGFVIASVAVRFSYPAVSLEGSSFWIIKSSPMGLKKFLWCKFWVNVVFLFVLAEVLIISSNYLLNVDRFMMILSTVTTGIMTFAITSMSIGFGAAYPRFKYENVSQIPTGFGGLMFMITSVLFVGFVVVMEAWPVHIYIMSQLAGLEPSKDQLYITAASFVFVFITAVAALTIPMKIGIRSLQAREEF